MQFLQRSLFSQPGFSGDHPAKEIRWDQIGRQWVRAGFFRAILLSASRGCRPHESAECRRFPYSPRLISFLSERIRSKSLSSKSLWRVDFLMGHDQAFALIQANRGNGNAGSCRLLTIGIVKPLAGPLHQVDRRFSIHVWVPLIR